METKTYLTIVLIITGLIQVLMGIHLYKTYPKLKLSSGESQGMISARKIKWHPVYGGMWVSVYDEDGVKTQATLIPIKMRR